MKLNKKGFMMTEVIVVSVMIVVILTTMYTGYNRLIRSYNQKIDYYNVDGIYLLAFIRDSVIIDGDLKKENLNSKCYGRFQWGNE